MAKSAGRKFSIGVDYGTNSVRALVVDTANGDEIASHVYNYPSGCSGVLLDSADPNLARQNPADYIDGFDVSVKRAVAAAKRRPGFKPENVVGIGIDTTGSTPIPVDRQGQPLAMQRKFRNNLAAHAWLWKDHTSAEEAAAIGLANQVCPSSDLRAKGLETARTIAAKGPVAVRLAKQAVQRGANLDLFAACALETDLFAQAFGTQDQKEGMGAFLEKRPARFDGR